MSKVYWTEANEDFDRLFSNSQTAELQFQDDFAEFKARADSGGSTYGMLRRQAFAQHSLRGVSVTSNEPVTVPQRRAKSLIPPAVSVPELDVGSSSGEEGQRLASRRQSHHHHHHRQPHDTEHRDSGDGKSNFLQIENRRRRHSFSDVSNCLELDKDDHEYHRRHHHQHHHRSRNDRDQQQHPAKANQQSMESESQRVIKMDTLQLPTDSGYSRRVSAVLATKDPSSWPIRRRSWQPGTSSPTPDDGNLDSTSPLNCRRRSFTVTPKGDLVNEGDVILPRFFKHQDSLASDSTTKSRSNTSMDDIAITATDNGDDDDTDDVYRVLVLGGPDVGKTAIVQQFLTSEYMAAQNTSFDDSVVEIRLPVLLNGSETVMEFIDLPYTGNQDEWREYQVDGYLVVYSITDRRSFQKATDIMDDIRRTNSETTKPLMLVGNKTDLERSRTITKAEGRTLSRRHNSKRVEVSAILNHKIDDLLVAVVKQYRTADVIAAAGIRRATASSGGDMTASRRKSSTADESGQFPDTRPRSPGVFSRLLRAASPAHRHKLLGF